ncbi:MAG: hypothetical protein AB1Z23_10430 [Eubacteriales bacterium]
MDIIKLTIPAKAQYLLTARLASSSIGARINMTIGDVDDLKTAVAEGCILLISSGRYTDISIEYTIKDNTAKCEIKGLTEREDAVEADIETDLSKYILEATTSELEIHKAGDTVDYVKFVKTGI